MFDIALTTAERALLEALNDLGVRYLIVGMGAALIEGAPATTQDLDLWFGHIDADRLREAARRAGGLYTAGFGLRSFPSSKPHWQPERPGPKVRSNAASHQAYPNASQYTAHR